MRERADALNEGLTEPKLDSFHALELMKVQEVLRGAFRTKTR
jgi:hypothetical protein